MNDYIIEPLFDNVLVLPQTKENQETNSGILLPDSANETPNIAEVIATGEGKTDKSGNLIPLKIKAGDQIIYKQWGTNTIKMGGKEYLLLREEDILAKVRTATQ